MQGILLILSAILFFMSAYSLYGKYLSKKFGARAGNETPSHTMRDGVDYVPAKAPVLLGHHFASIAGAGPIAGPVLAAGFGWLPVFLWIVLGSIFIGGVHDYSAIMVSVRHKGRTIGMVIENYLGISGKKLFLIFAWATLILVVAVFAIIIARTFAALPEAGTSSILFILVAVLFGIALYKFRMPLWLGTIIGTGLLALCVYAGQLYPVQISETGWFIILFAYISVASVTPVWVLIQPRDYLNSFFLYALIAGGIAGMFFALPELKIPAFATYDLDKIGPLFPALFVTVACGAISGFHSIVGSGTTSKQLNKETDGKIIGYGGMLLEGVLAVLALIAAASLVEGDFISIMNTGGPVAAFSEGVAGFMNSIPLLNISMPLGRSFVALAVAAFALTSLDTATRLARYSLQEYFEYSGGEKKNLLAKNRYAATGITVAAGAVLTISGQSMALWPLFGSANQLLAALALLAVTVWVANKKMNTNFVMIPMLIMFAITLTALGIFFYTHVTDTANYPLAVISLLLLILAVNLGYKAWKVLRPGVSTLQDNE